MRHDGILRFGGKAAIAVGILYLLVAATHFLMPRAQLRGAERVDGEFFMSLAQGAFVFQLHYWIVVALALLTLAVVLAFRELLPGEPSGPAAWAVVLGGFGAALMALDFAQFGVLAPRLAAAYAAAEPGARPLLASLGVPHSDPCFLAYGLLGGFALIVNLALRRRRRLPRPLVAVGVLGGGLYLLLFAGSLLRMPLLVDIAVGAGGLIAAPIWYVWSGLVLIGKGRPPAGPEVHEG
jgi:hypothetical protein